MLGKYWILSDCVEYAPIYYIVVVVCPRCQASGKPQPGLIRVKGAYPARSVPNCSYRPRLEINYLAKCQWQDIYATT